jgi:hypothetical protein
MVQEGIDRVGRDVASPLVGEAFQNARVERIGPLYEAMSVRLFRWFVMLALGSLSAASAWKIGCPGWAVYLGFGNVTHRVIADALEARTLSNLFKAQPSPPGTMVFVIEKDREYRALGRFFPFYELSYLVNPDDAGNPRLAISNREVLDPATGTYPTTAIPAVSRALVGLCQNHRSNPQYGVGGFVSNGTIETVTVIADHSPPGFFQTIRGAIRVARADGPEPTAPVRLARETAPIGGACVSPCCSDR